MSTVLVVLGALIGAGFGINVAERELAGREASNFGRSTAILVGVILYGAVGAALGYTTWLIGFHLDLSW